MPRRSNYDKSPFVAAGTTDECSTGWEATAARLAPHFERHHVLCLECYPGTFVRPVLDELSAHLFAPAIFFSQDCLKTPVELRAMLNPLLGDDRVFGRMSDLSLEDYFDLSKLADMRLALERAADMGPVIVIGAGAALISPPGSMLVYADIARREIQLRWRRREIGNLGLNNSEDKFAAKYKCGFFAEWRAADRLKKHLLPTIDFLLDTNQPQMPKLIDGCRFVDWSVSEGIGL